MVNGPQRKTPAGISTVPPADTLVMPPRAAAPMEFWMASVFVVTPSPTALKGALEILTIFWVLIFGKGTSARSEQIENNNTLPKTSNCLGFPVVSVVLATKDRLFNML